MFYNQPLAVRFGTELLRQVDREIEPFWDSLDIAVAWVRASGMAHLSDRLKKFLQHGGQISVIVGIDLQNTTREGLQALLELERHGQCETFVYHNEAGSIFHPKLYLFRNEEEARLIVGSNNITESGLYVNVEAGLQVDTEVNATVIAQTLDALSSWKDTTDRFAVRLDPDFLARLVENKYVPDETAVSARISRESSRGTSRAASLFASRRFTPPERAIREQRAPTAGRAPAKQLIPSQTSATRTPGTVLLMRLRKSRGTQTQIPFRVRDTFFREVRDVRSVRTGVVHGIRPASAGGNRNTIKLEIPETTDFDDPVARFERTDDGIVYEAFDTGSPQGNQIMASLQEGLRDGSTQQTIRDTDRATLWRFI